MMPSGQLIFLSLIHYPSPHKSQALRKLCMGHMQLLHASFCSPSRAETQVPAGGHRCLRRFPLGRGCPAAVPEAVHALSPSGCRRPALSRTGNAADMGASRSSGAAGNEKYFFISHKKKVHVMQLMESSMSRN